MNKEDIQALFCCKLYRECVQFKEEQLELSKEEIFANSYMNDSMLNIYEGLVEVSQKMETEAMKQLLFIPNLLAHFYECWLKVEDSQYKEMNDFLRKNIREVLFKQEVVA